MKACGPVDLEDGKTGNPDPERHTFNPKNPKRHTFTPENPEGHTCNPNPEVHTYITLTLDPEFKDRVRSR